MAYRRQVYVFTISDNGSESIEDLERFPEKEQSIMTSGYGNANQAKRASTQVNQFITVEAMGSTPGLLATNTNWSPRGSVNLQVENTYFFQSPDRRLNEGVSGTAAPYPISVQNQRSYNSFPRVYLSGGTNYDVTYYMASSFIGAPDTFSGVEFTITLSS